MESKTANDEYWPSWLDKSFIVNALKNEDPDTDESKVEVVLREKVEGGYLSQTFRVVVRSDSGSRAASETSLIVKAAPNVGGTIQDVINSGVYTKEEVAYGQFLPAVNSVLKKAEGSKWQTLGPKLYALGSQPVSFLVVEDLDAAGFRKEKIGLDLNLSQCRTVMHSIARMHGASLKVLNDWQYASKVFRQSLIFNDLMLQHQEKGEENFSRFLQALDNYSWFHKYTDKIRAFTSNLYEKSVELVKQCHVDFKVMLHGDLHKNNMVFRAVGDDMQVRFFDFQGLHIGSPAEDLHYFLHTSASPELLQQHTDLLLSEYHSTLQQTLRALGLQQQADAYPLEQLRRDMDHFALIAVFITFGVLPVIVCTNQKDVPTDITAEDYEERIERFRQKTCKNKKFLKHVEYLVRTFDSRGLLETQVA
ncbi:uncharacterized protein LOC126236839 [Schistocerca nitens]|uniref:uncharacterized protein LOC126236839 n=1 Tax=Schistocerca nitens TaxID=7011 RepID=UPI0021190538|nr:uncharacterized protein LOC126236839 [Schistocerca nitens]